MSARKSFTRSTKTRILAAGFASLLLAGCAGSPEASPAETTAPTTAATTGTTQAAAASAAPSGDAAYQAYLANSLFETRLFVDQGGTRAGESIRVTGGTYAPGTTVEVRASQIMAMPSYDAENDMYHQVGEQIHITDVVVVTADAEGKFDTQLQIPAGTPAQQIDVWSKASDGMADLVRSSVS
jgi:hypothetical protein